MTKEEAARAIAAWDGHISACWICQNQAGTGSGLCRYGFRASLARCSALFSELQRIRAGYESPHATGCVGTA